MNKHRSLILFFLLFTALAMISCAVFGVGGESTPVVSQPGGQGQPAGATEAVVQLASPTPIPTSTEQPKTRTRGTGDFNMLAANLGLDALPSYHAVLEMTFNGTRDGAPYQLKKAYDVIVDRPIEGRSQLQTSTAADGAVKQVFSAAFGSVRYLQAAPDQPCRASILEKTGPAPFEPALMLPLLEGSVAAGTETVNEVEADAYTFDALALNAGPEATASGKLWVARAGGWLVKYELSLTSASLFGAGISGEQRWSYNLTQAGAAQFGLPAACPQGEVDLPLPDGAQVRASLPNYMQLSAGQPTEALVTFYRDTLVAQYWIQQGDPVVSESGTRLVFSRPVQDKEQMAVITIRAGADGAAVTIFEILTEPVMVP